MKVGCSKRGRKEYEHKAPRRVVDALVDAIARRSANGRRFTVEDVFPLKDGRDHSVVPSYQAYVALAWLKTQGLVRQRGRSGYTLRTGLHLRDAVVASWSNLTEF